MISRFDCQIVTSSFSLVTNFTLCTFVLSFDEFLIMRITFITFEHIILPALISANLLIIVFFKHILAFIEAQLSEHLRFIDLVI
jgi:hypothetical protein